MSGDRRDIYQFMRIMVDSPEIVACYILHDQQLRIFNAVKDGATTSNKVAEVLGISVPNASNVLRDLYKIGYLFRRPVSDPTGGWIYEYRSFYTEQPTTGGGA